MLYFILMPLNLICSLFCYITNPIVVLFANEVGDLPSILKYWQTWDDALDVDFYVKRVVSEFLRYDFDSKYIAGRQNTPELTEVGRDRGCVTLRPGATFSFKEKVQRYFCRVGWLTRNNAYGFAFYLFGRKPKGSDIKLVKNIIGVQDPREEFVFAYDKSQDIFNTTWILYINWPLIGNAYLNVFLGWKMDYPDHSDKRKMAMIANRISIRFM